MKKLYNRKGKVHPSPPLISDHLSFLPAAILTLTAALSPEDREVLAYLISCSGSSEKFSGGRKNTQRTAGVGGSTGGGGDHPPFFNCDCFRCYMRYWVRWDSSPNRQLIHEIIDAYEDSLLQAKTMKNKKDRRKRGDGGCGGSSDTKSLEESLEPTELGESESTEVGNNGSEGSGEAEDDEAEEELERGSVRRFMSFIGERIWGVWGQ